MGAVARWLQAATKFVYGQVTTVQLPAATAEAKHTQNWAFVRVNEKKRPGLEVLLIQVRCRLSDLFFFTLAFSIYSSLWCQLRSSWLHAACYYLRPRCSLAFSSASLNQVKMHGETLRQSASSINTCHGHRMSFSAPGNNLSSTSSNLSSAGNLLKSYVVHWFEKLFVLQNFGLCIFSRSYTVLIDIFSRRDLYFFIFVVEDFLVSLDHGFHEVAALYRHHCCRLWFCYCLWCCPCNCARRF